MRNRKKTTIYTLFIILVLMIMSVVYFIWNKPHQNILQSDALAITSAALYDSLSKNNTVQNPGLLNKVVEVSGIVKDVLKNQQGQQVVLLQTNRNDASINCTMEENLDEKIVGTKITLKGMCIGYSGGDITMDLPGDVMIIRCYPI